jgi:hypothetical protein
MAEITDFQSRMVLIPNLLLGLILIIRGVFYARRKNEKQCRWLGGIHFVEHLSALVDSVVEDLVVIHRDFNFPTLTNGFRHDVLGSK